MTIQQDNPPTTTETEINLPLGQWVQVTTGVLSFEPGLRGVISSDIDSKTLDEPYVFVFIPEQEHENPDARYFYGENIIFPVRGLRVMDPEEYRPADSFPNVGYVRKMTGKQVIQ